MKIKPVSAWAISHWRCGIYSDTIRATRAEAIAAFKQQYGMPEKKWRHDRKWGIHNALRVTVSRQAPPSSSEGGR